MLVNDSWNCQGKELLGGRVGGCEPERGGKSMLFSIALRGSCRPEMWPDGLHYGSGRGCGRGRGVRELVGSFAGDQ